MRIISLLPAATEVLYSLGLADQIVGVSHECDYPAAARSVRRVIHSRIPAEASAGEIDRLVSQLTARGESLYSVDVPALLELQPDLIITQDLCQVCAASPADLAVALASLSPAPQVLCMNASDLAGVARDIRAIAQATGCGSAGAELLGQMIGRQSAIASQIALVASRPRVVFLEWLDPLFIAGHWVPEMIDLAGGRDALGVKGQHSRRITPRDVIDAAPDVLIIAPCGYDREAALAGYHSMVMPREWAQIPALTNDRVFAFASNSYSSRPGPRLITGIEALAKAFHPAIAVGSEAQQAFSAIPVSALAASAAR